MKRRFHLPRGPESASDEVRREIELHLDLRAREVEAQGMTPADARRAAAAAFGDRSEIEAEVSTLRGGTDLPTAASATASAISRRTSGSPCADCAAHAAFTVISRCSRSRSASARTARSSASSARCSCARCHTHAEQLVQLWTDTRSRGRAKPEWLTPTFRIGRMGTTPSPRWPRTRGGDPISPMPERRNRSRAAATSWDFLNVLGVTPAIGRGFSAADDNENAAKVVILSDGLWPSAFWRRRVDPQPLSIQLGGDAWTVIGVLPRDFHSPVRADVWRPTRRPANGGCGRGCVVLGAIGRLKPGVTVAQAKATSTSSPRAMRPHTRGNKGVSSWPIALHEQITGPWRPALRDERPCCSFC